jgi:hypothetical protein
MGRTAQKDQDTPQGDPRPEHCPGPDPCHTPPPQGGAALIAGQALALTVRHFFPDLNRWLDRLPDTRDQDAITYETRFLGWWGIGLYLFQLGSRRQLDFDLDANGTHVLDNFNRLAQTDHDTRPVHDTLDHFLEHVAATGFVKVRTGMVRRLVRMKALDDARLLGKPVVLIDGTGLLCFHRPHCDHCLTQKHEQTTVYLHNVLEAKMLGPAGIVVSAASEFIENADAAAVEGQTAEQIKQDCELKAFNRLVPQLKAVLPQTQLVIAGDSIFACGRVFQACKDNHWSYVLSFKEGHMPAVWADFQALLPLCPKNVLERELADGTRRVFRWVPGLSYVDDQNRRWTFHAVQCMETDAEGTVTRFAWLTALPVTRGTVEDIAEKGGRDRWKIENQGFNRQKNSGLNLCHVYSTDPEKWKAYYYLLQIAFIITQLLERGSLLRQLAAEQGRTPLQLFGSLKNLARRMLDAVRWLVLPEESFDARVAGRLKIHLNTS